jgi:hypothetical protein
MPSSAWAGWICFESEVEVEAAKTVPYRRLILRVIKLSSEVYVPPAVEERDCDVMYSIDCVH